MKTTLERMIRFVLMIGLAQWGGSQAMAIDPCNPPLASSAASRSKWLVIEGRPMTEAEIRAAVAAGTPKNVSLKDCAFARFFSAVWHVACADGPGDRELLRKLIEGPEPEAEVAYALAALGEPGARELFSRLVQQRRFGCAFQVIDAGRMLALEDPRGVPFFFEALDHDARPELCVGSAKFSSKELATQAAKIADFDYVAGALALLERDPKVFGDLVAELLARGAAVEKWQAASCRALQMLKVEAPSSQRLVAEQIATLLPRRESGT